MWSHRSCCRLAHSASRPVRRRWLCGWFGLVCRHDHVAMVHRSRWWSVRSRHLFSRCCCWRGWAAIRRHGPSRSGSRSTVTLLYKKEMIGLSQFLRVKLFPFILPFAAADLCLCFYLLAQELCVALVQPFRNEIQAGGIKVRINDYVLFIRTADGP